MRGCARGAEPGGVSSALCRAPDRSRVGGEVRCAHPKLSRHLLPPVQCGRDFIDDRSPSARGLDRVWQQPK